MATAAARQQVMEAAPGRFNEASRVEIGQSAAPSTAAALTALLGSTIGIVLLTTILIVTLAGQ